MLEQEDLLHFSCVKLPNETTANSSNFSLVSNVRSPSTRRQQTSPELKANLSSKLELIGDGVNSLAEITREREIEVWQEKKFDLEMRLIDTDDERRIELINERIDSLDEKIQEKKRPRFGL